MTITFDVAKLDGLVLQRGGHDAGSGEYCFMEAVAMLVGEDHSDRPTCVSPYLTSFGITLNDRAPSHEARQDLLQFARSVVGTASDGLDDRRRWMAADHVARVSVPRWLDAAGLTEHAAALRALPTISNREEWRAARDVIRAARDAAYELRRDRRAKLRAAVEKALAERPVAAADAAAAAAAVAVAVAAAAAAADAAAAAAAAAAAVAVAVAAAAADAAADAVAVAVAVAAADAAAAAVAVAAAAAAAAADAVADAVAVAVADDRYWRIRNAVYKTVYARLRAAYGERFAQLTAESWTDAVQLYGRLINPDA